MSTLDITFAELRARSDIPANSDAYAEIERSLNALALRLAFFVFVNRAHAHYARKLEDGQAQVFPVFTLYLKYDEDYLQTGIDRRQGNWDDKWEHTDTVRNAVNAVLERHKYGSDYVSDKTFIFVDSRERIVFDQIGRASKGVVRELVRREAPELEVAHIFWSSERKYHIILRHPQDYQRAKRTLMNQIAKALPTAIAAADEHGYCRCYEVAVELGHTGMNLYHLARED